MTRPIPLIHLSFVLALLAACGPGLNRLPAAPTEVTAAGGFRSLTVTWAAASAPSGAPVTGYTITAAPSGKSVQVDASATSAQLSGLADATEYTVTVAATNQVGTGPASSEAKARTAGTPAAPTGVSVTGGVRSLQVSWSAPTDDGGDAIQSYLIVAQPGGAQVTTSAAETTATVTGLENATQYTVSVSALNRAGTGRAVFSGAASTASPPAPPRNVVAIAGSGSVSVSWDAPQSDGGAPITGYEVIVSGSEFTVGANERSLTVSGVTSIAPATAFVYAINEASWSEAAASNPVTPFPVPAVVQDLVAGSTGGSCQAIQFALVQPDYLPADLSIEYAVGDGGFRPVTLSWGSENTGRPTSANGAWQELSWNSYADIGSDEVTATVRIIPQVAGADAGTPALTTTVVRNSAWFAPGASSALVNLPRFVRTADMDNDGKLDLVVGSGGTTEQPTGQIGVVLMRDGFTSEADTMLSLSEGISDLAVGDLDEDGLPEVVVVNGARNQVGILGGTGAAVGSERTVAVPLSPEYVALGHLNGDAHLDVVTATMNPVGYPAMAVLYGQGDGGFTAGPRPGTDGVSALATANLSGDGFEDIVYGTQSGQVGILVNQRDGGFEQGPVMPVSSNGITSLVTGDLDGDGRMDLLAGDGWGAYPLMSAGAGSVQVLAKVTAPSTFAFGAPLESDFDGDGHPDVVLSDGERFLLFRGQGDGGFREPLSSSTDSMPWITGIVAMDSNGDGLQDIVSVGNSYPTPVTVQWTNMKPGPCP